MYGRTGTRKRDHSIDRRSGRGLRSRLEDFRMLEARDFGGEPRAFPAGLNTVLHAVQRGAVLFAGPADFGADQREAVVKLALAAQGIGSEGADARAIQHQPEMLRPGMLAAGFQTVGHRHGSAYRMAALKRRDGLLYLPAQLVHGPLMPPAVLVP